MNGQPQKQKQSERSQLSVVQRRRNPRNQRREDVTKGTNEQPPLLLFHLSFATTTPLIPLVCLPPLLLSPLSTPSIFLLHPDIHSIAKICISACPFLSLCLSVLCVAILYSSLSSKRVISNLYVLSFRSGYTVYIFLFCQLCLLLPQGEENKKTKAKAKQRNKGRAVNAGSLNPCCVCVYVCKCHFAPLSVLFVCVV